MNPNSVRQAIIEQRYVIGFALMSLMTVNSIENYEQFISEITAGRHEIGVLKISHTLGSTDTKFTEFETHVNIDLKAVMNHFEINKKDNITFVTSVVNSSIIFISDMLDSHNLYGYKSKGEIIRDSVSPEIEFLKHIRNGIAHGNKFTIAKGHPKFLAHFNKLNISQDLNGKKVLGSFTGGVLDFGDIIELFDKICDQLKSLEVNNV